MIYLRAHRFQKIRRDAKVSISHVSLFHHLVTPHSSTNKQIKLLLLTPGFNFLLYVLSYYIFSFLKTSICFYQSPFDLFFFKTLTRSYFPFSPFIVMLISLSSQFVSVGSFADIHVNRGGYFPAAAYCFPFYIRFLWHFARCNSLKKDHTEIYFLGLLNLSSSITYQNIVIYVPSILNSSAHEGKTHPIYIIVLFEVPILLCLTHMVLGVFFLCCFVFPTFGTASSLL